MTEGVTYRSEYVVVGSGPGGATVARGLAQAGRDVLLLERGKDLRKRWYYGTYLGALLYSDRMSFLYSAEGLNIIRPLMVGGATSMYCACAAPPPAWLKGSYEIDIGEEVVDTIKELAIAPLAPDLRGRASTRLAEAAQALGYDWQPQDKFMQPQRAHPFRCRSTCMLGCRCGAKWNAAEYVDEAVQAGAGLRTGAGVERILVEDGQVTGVRGAMGGMPFAVRA